jgi:hypothetical protein
MPMLQEKYRVPHFDAKAEANAYFAGVPTTFLVTSFYWDNLYSFGLAPKKGDDGVYSWTFPMGDSKLAGIAAETSARWPTASSRAAAVRRQDHRDHRREPDAQRDERQARQGPRHRRVKYNAVDADAYRGFGFPGADEMGNMFQVYRDFEKEVLAARSAETTRQLNPQAQNFDQFIAKNKSKIEAAHEGVAGLGALDGRRALGQGHRAGCTG